GRPLGDRPLSGPVDPRQCVRPGRRAGGDAGVAVLLRGGVPDWRADHRDAGRTRPGQTAAGRRAGPCRHPRTQSRCGPRQDWLRPRQLSWTRRAAHKACDGGILASPSYSRRMSAGHAGHPCMARIPDAFIDDLLARSDIVELIGARVPLKRQGKEYSACCPFHDERTPSFTVSPTKQFYYCFGCQASGTAISFLMNYDRLEFLDAVDELARHTGMEVPRDAEQR